MTGKRADAARQGIVIGLSAVIVSAAEMRRATGAAQIEPRVFIVRGAEHALSVGMGFKGDEGDALPFGPFDPVRHGTPELGLRSWVRDQTPIVPGYVEQLYTFGSRGRYATEGDEELRVISIGYLALTHQEDSGTSEKLFWGDWYTYFPWEDWRNGKPDMIDAIIVPVLLRWAESGTDSHEKNRRRARVKLCFGIGDIAWDEEKVLERYELMYEAALMPEAVRDGRAAALSATVAGKTMLYDHRRILATAMGRLRGKLKYRPVVFELMPDEFTLLQLQRTVEAIMGHSLHKQNFRRLVENSGMVEEVQGKKSAAAGGRPAALFRFRRDVGLERPQPGMKLSSTSV